MHAALFVDAAVKADQKEVQMTPGQELGYNFFCRLGRGSTGQNLWVFAPSLVFLVQDLAMHSDVVAARLKDTDDDVCYEAGANTRDS